MKGKEGARKGKEGQGRGGRAFVAKNFLRLSSSVFYCAHALANILVLLAEGAVGCQEVFALVLALVNISPLLPLLPVCHWPTRVNLACKKGSVPVRGECTHPTSSRFLHQAR